MPEEACCCSSAVFVYDVICTYFSTMKTELIHSHFIFPMKNLTLTVDIYCRLFFVLFVSLVSPVSLNHWNCNFNIICKFGVSNNKWIQLKCKHFDKDGCSWLTHQQMSLVLWLEIIRKQECADILPYCYVFFHLIITHWMHFFS